MDSTPNTRTTASSCPPTSWAPSSAFYFLLSLALGCISHPRGSLTFNRSSRAWRLSPIFLLIENIKILTQLFQCVRSQGWRWNGKAVRIYAFAILALREGNVWRQGEYDAFFGEEGNERFLVGEEDGEEEFVVVRRDGEIVEGGGSGEGIQRDGIGPGGSRLSRITRRATDRMEEGRGSPPAASAECSIAGDPTRLSLEDWFTIGSRVPSSKGRRALTEGETMIAKRKAKRLLDARFRRNLEQVQDYEKGPTFRLSLWYPMVVQLAKAASVSGARFTISMGMIYLASFLVIEGCLFAARKPLNDDDRVKALKLLREWGRMELVLKYHKLPRRRRRGIFLASASAEVWEGVWVAVASMANIFLLCWIFDYSLLGRANILLELALENCTMLAKAFQKPWYWWPVLIPLTPFIFIAITVGEGIALFSSCVLVAWAAGVPFIIARCVEEAVNNYQEHSSTVPDRREGRFFPAATAIATGALAFVAYFGFLSATGGLSYDCSTTGQKSFYNFLG
jgi:hypothetical protein